MSDQIKFKKSLFGISKKPVVEYIDSISRSVDEKLFKKDSEISDLKKMIEELKKEKEALLKEIDDFKEEKNKISEVFLKAEETANITIENAKNEADGLIKNALIKIDEENKKNAQEQSVKKAEFDAEISEKQKELNNYKNEINFLREKITVTLNKFDEILANTVN